MFDPIRILLVDDSPYFLEAARGFLHIQERFDVIGSASEGMEAVALSEWLQPDIILLDLNLGDRSGLELIPLFKEKLPNTRIVVLTVMQDDSYRAAALQTGADAFVHKTAMSKSLCPVILELVQPARNGTNSQESHNGNRETVIEKSETQGSGPASESSERTSMIGLEKEPNA
jgi:DNA-binding NarL/FixJ family response regulator